MPAAAAQAQAPSRCFRDTSPSSWTATGAGPSARAAARTPATAQASRPCARSIEECARRGVGALTLFAFSSENWQRPADEVGVLMQLFLEALDREVDELDANGVRLRFIGDRTRSRRRCSRAHGRGGGS